MIVYNDNEPFAAQWLRNLVAAGHLPLGAVDDRPIQELSADDLRHATHVHLFAGIGGWPLALRLAGWPAARPVWTGSCPCQPFSIAGHRRGVDDERHLWPEMRRLIVECRPPTIFGEQVAGRAGRTWLAAVRADLEDLGYAVGAADLCAASVGAPHIRQRLFWVAVRGRAGLEVERVEQARAERQAAERSGAIGGMVLAHGERPRPGDDAAEAMGLRRSAQSAGWDDVEWLPCLDGKWRPTQPGLQLLAHGVPRGLVVVCPYCDAETEIGDGLRVVWRRTCWEGQEQTQVLQPILYGIGDGACPNNVSGRSLSSAESLRSDLLQEMWRDLAVAPTPQGSKRNEQRSQQYRGVVHHVPFERAQARAGAVDLRGVWRGLHGQGPQKASEDLLCWVCGRMGTHECRKAMGARVGQLRAYGNAIVPQVAAAFVTAFLQSANR